MKLIGLALSNAIVALSGGLLSQYSGFSDVNMGRGGIVIGLAAVIIGEVLGDAILGKHMNFMGKTYLCHIWWNCLLHCNRNCSVAADAK